MELDELEKLTLELKNLVMNLQTARQSALRKDLHRRAWEIFSYIWSNQRRNE